MIDEEITTVDAALGCALFSHLCGSSFGTYTESGSVLFLTSSIITGIAAVCCTLFLLAHFSIWLLSKITRREDLVNRK